MTTLLAIFISSAWGLSCQSRYIDWQNPNSICTQWSHQDPLKKVSLTFLETESISDAVRAEFNLLVKTMTDQVAGDTPNGSLSSNRRYVVSRLASVKLELVTSKDPLCPAGSQVNARYAERTNKIQVCPLTLRLPKGAWLPLFAHELGHLADPCNFRQGFEYTERVPRSSAGVKRVVSECGVPAVGDLMSDGDHRADRAIAIGVESSSALRQAVPKLIACGVLEPLGDLELPETKERHPYANELRSCRETEATADQIGFRVLGAHLRTHRLNEGPEWITYFYASVNCSASEHSGGKSEYSASAARMEAFLKIPEVRKLAKCE